MQEASQYSGRSVNQILMEATKGPEHLELLYWVEYKRIHKDHQILYSDTTAVAGDYLVVPKERVVELRHQEQVATDCFYFPERSPMHQGMVNIRQVSMKFGDNNQKKGVNFIRCETLFILNSDDENLVVTGEDLDLIWPDSKKEHKAAPDSGSDVKPADDAGGKENTLPTELCVALEAEKEFSSVDGVNKTRDVIKKFIHDRLTEKGGVPITDNTCQRIAELITCGEMPMVMKAYDAVYSRNLRATRTDMEIYLHKHHGLKPTSAAFRRIVAVTTRDNRKKGKK